MNEMIRLVLSCGLLMILALVIVCYPFRKQKSVFFILGPLLTVLIAAGYWQWGGEDAWYQYIQQGHNQKQIQAVLDSVKSPAELIEKLKTRLQNQPDSAKGWYLLGRLYVSQNNWKLAHEAFTKAKALEPDDERIQINDAQCLWEINNRKFNDTIINTFQEILAKNANQPYALAMLAMDSYIRHDNAKAIAFWQRLLILAPPDSDDAKAIRKAIAKAQT